MTDYAVSIWTAQVAMERAAVAFTRLMLNVMMWEWRAGLRPCPDDVQ